MCFNSLAINIKSFQPQINVEKDSGYNSVQRKKGKNRENTHKSVAPGSMFTTTRDIKILDHIIGPNSEHKKM